MEGCVGGQGGDEHAHRMSIVSERVHKLQSVCVGRSIHEDVVRKGSQLLSRGQLTIDEQEGHFEKGRLLSQLFDPVSTVLEDSPCPIDIADP